MARISVRLRSLWREMSPLDLAAASVFVVCLLAWGWERAGSSLPMGTPRTLLFLFSFGYLLIRPLPWLRRQLLWSLRNRLIVAYIFIAVVPVVLLLSLYAVGSYILFLQVGAHFLHDDIEQQRISVVEVARQLAHSMEDEAGAVSPPSLRELLQKPRTVKIIARAKREFPSLIVEIEPATREVSPAPGPGLASHADFVQDSRGLSFASSATANLPQQKVHVKVFVPVTPEILDRLPSELGPVALGLFEPAPGEDRYEQVASGGRATVPLGQVASRNRKLAPAANWLDWPVDGLATLEAEHGAELASPGTMERVFATFTARPSQLGKRLFQSVGSVGPTLVILLAIISSAFLLLEVAALITGIVLTRRITHAVGELYRATTYIRHGDFAHRVRVEQRDQLGSLGESFNEMTSSLAQLLEEQRQRQRLENELAIAREVQEQLFPKSLPSVPGVQLAAVCRAARTVSGDYYDFISLGPSCLALALADISGKGISAALLMASLQAALRGQALLDGNRGTAELVSRLNRYLFLNTSEDRYATFFYAVYDAAARMLTYTNAGHLPPYLIWGNHVMPLETGGMVVGLFDNCPYEQSSIPVEPGSLLVAFSDGLTEPENVYGEEFGVRRVREEVVRWRSADVDTLAESLVEAAEQWGGTPEQADDMTVLVARFG